MTQPTQPTHTNDKLAEALRKIGLTAMADKAAEGYYHDFHSPLVLPKTALVNDLARASLGSPAKDLILALRARVINGEFDASPEESDEWAQSAEGQDAFRRLIKGD